MSDHSAIQWTDATWNPTTGCTKISPGCAHCYIERTPAFRIAGNKFEHGKTDLQIFHDRLAQPLHWKKPRRVFVNSLSDLFHEDISDAFIDRVFAVMALSPWHTFQVLTKRAERMRDYCSALTLARLLPWMNDHAPDGVPLKRQTPVGGFVPTGAENLCTIARRAMERVYRFQPEKVPMRTAGPPLPNVWLGVSVENQHFADARIPLLLQTPAAVRFISAEPLLEAVDLRAFVTGRHVDARNYISVLDWVIVGGESGSQARPFDLEWARSIVSECRRAGVPCFVKQLGYRPIFHDGGGRTSEGLRDKKGGDMAEWPADLRVREFPGRELPA